MTDISSGPTPPRALPGNVVLEPIFVLTVFFSASLVFMVEPMIARLVLPLLGGSAAVWNTSLAFFQAALLAGYVYAHLLQRFAPLKGQILIHLVVLCLAAIALPLHVTNLFGEPQSQAPALWLVGVLAISIGAPFAALSATAPLIQAWHARVVKLEDGKEPYALYAASNVGSLIALLAYPVVVEPTLTLHDQTNGWSLGYGVFAVLAAILGIFIWRAANTATAEAPTETPVAAAPVSWRTRLTWLALAAIPSSLMLGVTTYVTTDLGSAPFLWIAPLALYLATFIIAFQAKPAISSSTALLLQAFALALCGVFIHFWTAGFVQELLIHLTGFFFTALICHQALVARRPEPARLTEFYIWMSLGGVVGGAFNAFIAPLIFSTVIEYPALLVLSCLVRPWGSGPVRTWEWILGFVAVLFASLAVGVMTATGSLDAWLSSLPREIGPTVISNAFLAVTAICACLLRGRALMFMGAIFILLVSAQKATDRVDVIENWRGFFGVLRVAHSPNPSLGGEIRTLYHGTTLHGAQAQNPIYRCRPLVYYAPETPIGQVFKAVRLRKPAVNIGAVGLGTGAVAAYTRKNDTLRFFEIDPLVPKISFDPKWFSYTTTCAYGHVSYTLGDARLTLAKQPAESYDLLLIDAFSSDSVPAHLLTVEAVKMYLSKLKPDGVLVLHLSNRNLDLMRPAQAVAGALHAPALAQEYWPAQGTFIWSAAEQAVIIGKSPASLAPFMADKRWSASNPEGVRPWTDDYTNLFGALVRRTRERWAGKP